MAAQLALFPDHSRLPDGLRYQGDFISAPLERELIARIAALPLQPFQFGQYEGKRRIASFGWRYDYSARRLLPAEPLPAWFDPLIKRVEAFAGMNVRIAQALCTEYDRGVGIGWHRDKPHFAEIFGISLESPCRLRFRRQGDNGWERLTLAVAPRSIYALAGPVRSEWEHSIPAVEARRYSLTLRTFKANPDTIEAAAPNQFAD